MSIERTLILAKPDAVARGLVGTILARFERRGLTIIGMKMIQANVDSAKKHYAEHEGKPFFSGLVEYLTSAPIIAFVVEGNDAVETARTLIGATNPTKAAPGSIRGDFAQTIGRNLVHGSDATRSAEREIAIWFSDAELHGRAMEHERWIIAN